jgi:hypothetical protein
MTYQIALLLNIAANSYQQALADEARETARKHGFELLPPSFANGSAMEQGSAALAYSRQKVSACLIYPVVTDMLVNVCQILATATVENPRTSGPAIELLAAFWKQGARTEHQVLKARSLPPLDQLKAISEP